LATENALFSIQKAPLFNNLSMSILFSETAQKKPPRLPKPKKSLSQLQGGLSSTPKSSSIPSIFGDFPDPFPSEPLLRPRKGSPDRPREPANGNRIVQQFIDSDPELKSRCSLVPNTTLDLTNEKKHAAAVDSAVKAQLSLAPVQRLAESILNRWKNRKADFVKDFRGFSPHKSDTYARKAGLCRYKDLFGQLMVRVNGVLDMFSEFSVKIAGILRLVQQHEDVDLLVRLGLAELEQSLAGFEATDPECLRLEQAIARERRELSKKLNYGDYGKCFELAQESFDPVTNSYPDTGRIDKLFGFITDREADEQTQKRIARMMQRPALGGKVALALANDAMKDRVRNTEAVLPAAFLMASRYLFSQLYVRAPCPQADPEFLRRIEEMRKFSPIVFDVNPGFLKPQLMGIAISNFPEKNRYREAVEFFRIAMFQYCPIDFCQVIRKAVTSIQQSASMKSWKTQHKATGMVHAKGDHLLSFDDLFDIALIIWLLAEPAAFQPLVIMWEPYIRGLELTSELEFAFTNITALVRHVIDLDFDRFLEQAKNKVQEVMEIDPLNILGS
jgi:hypothetical protein